MSTFFLSVAAELEENSVFFLCGWRKKRLEEDGEVVSVLNKASGLE